MVRQDSSEPMLCLLRECDTVSRKFLEVLQEVRNTGFRPDGDFQFSNPEYNQIPWNLNCGDEFSNCVSDAMKLVSVILVCSDMIYRNTDSISVVVGLLRELDSLLCKLYYALVRVIDASYLEKLVFLRGRVYQMWMIYDSGVETKFDFTGNLLEFVLSERLADKAVDANCLMYILDEVYHPIPDSE